jgi:transcriptional regulator with XRE-family HTH domain
MPQRTSDDQQILQLLGETLRLHREEAGKSQDTLANECGLHRTYVGAVERGERNPTYLSLAKYAGALNITVSDLLAGLR